MDKWKIGFWVFVFIICTAIVVVPLIIRQNNHNGGVMNAKIRYFDGTAEMIPVRRVTEHHASFELETTAGNRIIVGANNVIIIEEDTSSE